MKRSSLSFLPVLLVACATPAESGDEDGGDGDSRGGITGIATGLGALVDANMDGDWDQVDADGDGAADGYGVDTNSDGLPDAVGLDTDGNGVIESLDTDGDGVIDVGPSVTPGTGGTGSGGSPASVGGSPASVGGSPASVGGSPASVGGSPASVGGSPAGVGGSPLGTGGAGTGGDASGGAPGTGGAAPTCSDGVWNGDEMQLDCGAQCASPTPCIFEAEKAVINYSAAPNPVSTGSFQVTFDSTNLVFTAVLLDVDLRNDSGDNWEDDSIEIYLDMGNEKLSGFGSGDYQIRATYNDSAVEGVSGGSVVQSSVTGGYQLVVTVPWASIGGNSVIGQKIGIDFGFNDDVGGGTRDAQFMWNGTINNHVNTSTYGEIILK